MQVLDLLAAALVVGAAAAFTAGAMALARASDVTALYWFVLGVLALRSGARLARPELGA